MLRWFSNTYTYMSKDWSEKPAFIVICSSSLVYISNLTDVPNFFLIDDVPIPTQDTNQVLNSCFPFSFFSTYSILNRMYSINDLQSHSEITSNDYFALSRIMVWALDLGKTHWSLH